MLIVGGRYGSISNAGKSVTNLEFLGAKTKGIPIFVFVTRAVLDLLPTWQANPEADFSATTDSPKLFDFVANLKNSGDTWIFPFDVAQDIFHVLRNQIPFLFMNSLELRAKVTSAGGLPSKFRHLSGTLLRLIIERPPGWEYLLCGDALDEELASLGDIKRDWQHELAMGEDAVMTTSQFCSVFLPRKISDILRTTKNIMSLVNEALPIALGPPGVSGDPAAILYVAKRLAEAYRAALEWKLDFRRIGLPEELERLRSIVGRFCDNMIVEIELFSRTLKESLSSAIQAARAGQQVKIELALNLTMPDQSELQPELERILSLVQSGGLKWD